jgi:pimeloyl-ACP methyl ester carboxylesterase
MSPRASVGWLSMPTATVALCGQRPQSTVTYHQVGYSLVATAGWDMSELKYLELHGDRVAYREAGDGPAILLIHGMAGSSETWRAVMPQLARRHRVLAPDLLGHGQSAKPRGDYSLGAFAVWLRDFLDELGISRATLIGQSLGGGVAMQFVHQHPDYCERLVLIGSGGLGAEVGWTLRLLSAPGAEFALPIIAPQPVVALGQRFASLMSSLGVHSPVGTETWNAYSSLSEPQTRKAFLRTLRSVVDYRGQAVSAFSRLHFASGLPVLLIWGEQDRIIPVEHGRAAHEIVPGSQLLTLPRVGHYPHLEAPDVVNDAVTDFVARTTPWVWQRKGARSADASASGADSVGRLTPPT